MRIGDEKDIEARRKFILAFNSTMLKIWMEKISFFGVVKSGTLFRSLEAKKPILNADATEFRLDQEFMTYGIWQNYGVGKEVYRGNPGDIGRPKLREKRPWFDIKYYASVMKLRDFLGESLSQQYIAMMSNALSDRTLRNSVTED